MEQYKDKKSRNELLSQIKNIKLLGDIFRLAEKMYPGWILKTYRRYSDKKSNEIWFQTCKQFKTIPKQIIVVDFLYFDNKVYSNIILFADIFTKAGFSVVDKFRVKECKTDPSCIIRDTTISRS